MYVWPARPVPEPTADIGYLMDVELIREAWKGAAWEKRRTWLRLGLAVSA